jgi:Holliday junction resolvasome RuvABC endonuclease subunit
MGKWKYIRPIKSDSWEGLEKHFIGIDPSLTGNAVVIIDDSREIIYEHLVSTNKECYINPEQRISDIFEQIEYMFSVVRLKTVYIEGLAYSSNSNTLFERCGLMYLIVTRLLKADINYSIIPPTFLKKWHTTDGHADKKFMMRVAKCKYGIDFKDDNICDAYCLALLALEDYNNNVKRDFK